MIFALGMHENQLLRVGKGKLQITVRMEAYAHVGAQIIVDQVKHAQKVVFIHGAEGIDEIKRERAQLVHFFDEAQESAVRIRRCADGLKKHLVPFPFQAGGKGERLVQFLFVKGQANPLDGSAAVGYLFGRNVAVCNHRDEHRAPVPLFRQIRNNRLHAAEQTFIRIVRAAL